MMAGGPSSSIPPLLSFLNAGYAVVWQDARGAFESDGVFEPKVNETSDPSALMRLAGAFMDALPVNEATPVADLPVHGKGRWFDD